MTALVEPGRGAAEGGAVTGGAVATPREWAVISLADLLLLPLHSKRFPTGPEAFTQALAEYSGGGGRVE